MDWQIWFIFKYDTDLVKKSRQHVSSKLKQKLCRRQPIYKALQASTHLQSSAGVNPFTKLCRRQPIYKALQASTHLQSSAGINPFT